MERHYNVSGSNLAHAKKRTILITISIAYLVVMMDYSIINVALETLQKDFEASNSQLQWAVSSYEIFYSSFLLPTGFIADRYGRKRILLIGLGIFVASSGCITFSKTMTEIIIWRAAMGMGGAVVPAATLAIIKDTIPASEQNKAMGIWSAAGGASVALGPILGGFLVQSFPWWTVFLINVPIAAICAGFIYCTVPESYNRTNKSLDVPGIVLSIIGVGSLIFGLIKGGETGQWIDIESGGMLIIGLALIAVLVTVETHRLDPMLEMSLLRDKSFVSGTMSISLSYFALSGGTYLLVFFIQLIRQNTPFELGLLMLPVAIGAIVGSLLCDKLLQLFGSKTVVSSGMILLVLAFLGFSVTNANTNMILLELYFLSAGLGMGLTMGSTTPLTMTAIPQEKAGSGAGLTNTIRGITSIVGVGVLGVVYSLVYRYNVSNVFNDIPNKIPDAAKESLGQTLNTLHSLQLASKEEIIAKSKSAFVTAFHMSMWVAIIVLVLGLIVGWFLLPHKKQFDNRKNEWM
ncbi:MAG: MFS transporter [Sporolactobacillus sp.]